MGNNWSLLFFLSDCALIFLTHKLNFGSSFMLNDWEKGNGEKYFFNACYHLLRCCKCHWRRYRNPLNTGNIFLFSSTYLESFFFVFRRFFFWWTVVKRNALGINNNMKWFIYPFKSTRAKSTTESWPACNRYRHHLIRKLCEQSHN